MKSLSHLEIDAILRDHPSWSLHEGKLVRSWTFPGFLEAMAFVNRVASLAEQADHHPDIDIRYNRVLLGLISHDANGITRRDDAMVATLDRELPGEPAAEAKSSPGR